jgi:hypothetical protein
MRELRECVSRRVSGCAARGRLRWVYRAADTPESEMLVGEAKPS